jgi:hypothetical protein
MGWINFPRGAIHRLSNKAKIVKRSFWIIDKQLPLRTPKICVAATKKTQAASGRSLRA